MKFYELPNQEKKATQEQMIYGDSLLFNKLIEELQAITTIINKPKF